MLCSSVLIIELLAVFIWFMQKLHEYIQNTVLGIKKGSNSSMIIIFEIFRCDLYYYSNVYFSLRTVNRDPKSKMDFTEFPYCFMHKMHFEKYRL